MTQQEIRSLSFRHLSLFYGPKLLLLGFFLQQMSCISKWIAGIRIWNDGPQIINVVIYSDLLKALPLDSLYILAMALKYQHIRSVWYPFDGTLGGPSLEFITYIYSIIQVVTIAHRTVPPFHSKYSYKIFMSTCCKWHSTFVCGFECGWIKYVTWRNPPPIKTIKCSKLLCCCLINHRFSDHIKYIK